MFLATNNLDGFTTTLILWPVQIRMNRAAPLARGQTEVGLGSANKRRLTDIDRGQRGLAAHRE